MNEPGSASAVMRHVEEPIAIFRSQEPVLAEVMVDSAAEIGDKGIMLDAAVPRLKEHRARTGGEKRMQRGE